MIEKQGLKPIECQGTPFEIGYQYGSACQDSIRRSIELLEVMLRYGPLPLSHNKITNMAMKFLNPVQEFDPDGVAFVRGQAKGAGVDFKDAFALRCMLEVMVNFHNLAAMCTSFAVTGNATKDGKTIIGQNVDWHREAPVDLLRIEYPDGLVTFSIFLCASPYYHLTGAGLANCVNTTVNMTQPTSAHIPMSFYLSKALRQKRINRAMEVVKEAARGYVYFHLADAEGTIIGLESVADHKGELTPRENILVHANHYEIDRFKEGDLYAHIMPCSPLRARRLRELISSHHGSITPERMMHFLRDHHNHPSAICRHVDRSHPDAMPSDSRASFIMIPEEGRLFIANGPPCENEYHEYRL